MTYAEKLKDPRWQRKKNPWDVDEMYLTTLCHECHDKEEETVRAVKDLLDFYCLTCGTINGAYEILYKDIYG